MSPQDRINKVAFATAKRIFEATFGKNSYKAKGDLHKLIGKMISNMGITDAPEDFFVAAENLYLAKLEDAGMNLDLKDPKTYPALRQAIAETAENMGMLKG